MVEKLSYNPFTPQIAAFPERTYCAKYGHDSAPMSLVPLAPFVFILVLFSYVSVCRNLVASRRRERIVLGRRRLKLAGVIAQSVMVEKLSYNPFTPQIEAFPERAYFAKYGYDSAPHVAHPTRSIRFHPGAVLLRLRLSQSGRVPPTRAHRPRPTETEAGGAHCAVRYG